VLLETFGKVILDPPDAYEFRKNLNLYTNPGRPGRASSGWLLGSKLAISNVKTPVPDFSYFKLNGIWFLIVYISKNNRYRAEDAAEIEDNESGLAESDVSTADEHTLQANIREELRAGRSRILNTIRTFFTTFTKVVLLGD
jgi:hypothetical protein